MRLKIIPCQGKLSSSSFKKPEGLLRDYASTKFRARDLSLASVIFTYNQKEASLRSVLNTNEENIRVSEPEVDRMRMHTSKVIGSTKLSLH